MPTTLRTFDNVFNNEALILVNILILQYNCTEIVFGSGL